MLHRTHTQTARMDAQFAAWETTSQSTLDLLRHGVENIPCELIEIVRHADSLFADSILPVWCKVPSLGYKMVFSTKSYRDRYGAGYVGCNDAKHWPSLTADGFRANDKKVAETGQAEFFTEGGLNSLTGMYEIWGVHKWPQVFMSHGEPQIAVWGMVMVTHGVLPRQPGK